MPPDNEPSHHERHLARQIEALTLELAKMRLAYLRLYRNFMHLDQLRKDMNGDNDED